MDKSYGTRNSASEATTIPANRTQVNEQFDALVDAVHRLESVSGLLLCKISVGVRNEPCDSSINGGEDTSQLVPIALRIFEAVRAVTDVSDNIQSNIDRLEL